MRLLEMLEGEDYQSEEDYIDELHELIFNILESLNYEELTEEQQEEVDNLIELIDDDYYEQWYEDDDELEESRMQRVVRGGQVKRRLKPRKGYRVKDGKYVKVGAGEKRARRRGAKRAARKRKTKKGAIQRSRKKSMRRRKAAGLK